MSFRCSVALQYIPSLSLEKAPQYRPSFIGGIVANQLHAESGVSACNAARMSAVRANHGCNESPPPSFPAAVPRH